MALVGAAPFPRDSGRMRGKRTIWGGRVRLRAILSMAALTARKFNPVIRTFAARLHRAGKAFTVTQVACLRKLLVILNSMRKTNSLWDDKPLNPTPTSPLALPQGTSEKG